MSNKKSNSATSRLKQDYIRLKKDPVPYVVAEPLPSNILEWHYVMDGPENSPYEGGMYHGKLIFPREFPFKPPSIYMLTPNGRFKTNTRLCLSISDFHPDSWNPAWSVSTILTGLLSFMCEKSTTFGSIETSDHEKRQLAYNSLNFNLKDKQFKEQFPDLVEKIEAELERRRKEAESAALRGANGGPDGLTDPTLIGLHPGGGGASGGGPNNPASPLASALANLCVVVGVAAFALAVKYVVGTTAAAE